jgi:hypothetical protein
MLNEEDDPEPHELVAKTLIDPEVAFAPKVTVIVLVLLVPVTPAGSDHE